MLTISDLTTEAPRRAVDSAVRRLEREGAIRVRWVNGGRLRLLSRADADRVRAYLRAESIERHRREQLIQKLRSEDRTDGEGMR